MKKQKGITLIALIITIIVMLILVGVTINVALNGGLFEKAKDARDKTQKEVEREELLSIALGLYDVNRGIDKDELEEKIPNTYKIDTEKTDEEYRYIVKGKSGTLWQINLENAEVKENPWIGWGLTSSDVKYNTLFMYDDDKIIVYDNGELFVDFGIDEETGESTAGRLYKVDIENMLENEELILESDNKLSVYGGQIIFEFVKKTVDGKDIREVNLYYGGEFAHALIEQSE